MANARMTVDALREQVSRIEAEVGTQVSRLDAEIGTTLRRTPPFRLRSLMSSCCLTHSVNRWRLERKSLRNGWSHSMTECGP